jgi:hypothetical protein
MSRGDCRIESRGKYFGMMALAGMLLAAIFHAEPSWAQGKTTRRAGARAPLQVKAATEIGVGYQLWNEKIDLAQGGAFGTGYGHYGGFNFILERNWTRGSLQYGGSLGMGAGKATAKVTGVTFADGGDRPWYSASFAPFTHYKLNPDIMLGLGAMIRYRGVDWTPRDPSIRLETRSRFQYTGQIHLRWTVGNSLSFIQSYSPLGFEGESFWQFSLQAIL